MSKSPLSGAFAGSSATTKKKNKKNGAILLISGIALATSIGGVFAANSITINSGAAIEFGQGVAATSTCDTDGLTTSITQALPTSSNSTEFVARNVVVAGISSDCYQEDLVITLLGDQNAALTSTTIRPDAASETWDVSGANQSAGSIKRVSVTTQN
jgi:hypothetical protein